jgi:hypothetical protein
VKDVRLGLTGLGVADIMGELDVGHGRTVFVFPGNRSYVHVYFDSMYHLSCQEQISYSHAYTVFSFPETRLRDFNDLHHSKGSKMPTTVEAGSAELPLARFFLNRDNAAVREKQYVSAPPRQKC